MGLVLTDLKRMKRKIWLICSVRCCSWFFWVTFSPLHPLLPGLMLSNENSYLHCRGVQTSHMDRGRQCLSWISEHMWCHFYMGCFHKLQTATVSPSTALGTHKTKSHDHWEGKSNYKINQKKSTWSFTHTHTHTHTHRKITIRSVCGAFSSLSFCVFKLLSFCSCELYIESRVMYSILSYFNFLFILSFISPKMSEKHLFLLHWLH